jgi:hypothetical protein
MSMQASISVGISFPVKIGEKIDAERGDISRSRYVLKMIKRFYGMEQLQEPCKQSRKDQQQIESWREPSAQSTATLPKRVYKNNIRKFLVYG